MSDAEKRLAELAAKAESLNAKSGDLNKIIASFEERLAAMKLGVEVWMWDQRRDWFHSVQTNFGHRADSMWAALDTTEADVFEQDDYVRESYVLFLGYAKVGDSWRLAVREGTVRTTGEHEVNAEERFVENKRYPLAEAPRKIRIKAIGMMDNLLVAITTKVEEMLSDIEKGKKAVESID